MYSLMSSATSASSSPNRNSARVRDSSVLPTPEGPRKMNEPEGRLGSLRPARVRRIAWETALMAGSWPTTRLCSSSSIRSSLAVSSSVSLNTGMPVLGDPAVELAQVGRGGHAPDAHPAARLVDQVDRLVGQEPVGDVAVGQVGRGDQGVIGDRDPVVGLVAVTQALQDLDRVRHGGLVDVDRLEAALQGRVLLEVLAVLLEGGGADRLQLTARQHRLEDRGRVDRALGRARADQGVQLVDEQDDVAPRADLLEDLLEALLEVAAVARAGHQRAQVQGVELLALERLGHLALDDRLRQALDDGGLAHAGLA